ncbi:MAG: serine/threonine-protein kinase, partial [Planctomycetota bacterium]|nr:serine/threonine-protein kinase [Planctomycetota bacterium]
MACPRPDVISAASHESLPEEQLHSVYQHLTDCSDCWQSYLRARSDEPELTVPGYHIIKGLGHGASSVVYKAWRISSPRELVALKLLWPANDDQRARFEREIAVLSRLRLPNIVKCRESGCRGDMMYYAMDLIRGAPLDEHFRKRASGIDEKLEVFERVCRALAGAHAQGVAHRDLKPNNILVDDKGQPHILDFGLCTVDSSGWSTKVHQAQTKPGDVMGTVKYMAPEQAWGGLLDGSIDYRADIWALGIMLYELATDGRYPYDLGPSGEKTAEEALLHRIRTETPRPARIHSPVHSHDLKRLIDRCLSWDRGQRIQSVEALADDIGRCRQHAPIRTRSLPLRHRFQRITLGLAVRRRGLLWLCNVAAVLLLLSAFSVVFNVRWPVKGVDLAQQGRAQPLAFGGDDCRSNIL